MEQSTLEAMTFNVPQMDCAAEEQLVRMKLSDERTVKRVAFDTPNRTVVVTHNGDSTTIETLMQDLHLGAVLVNKESASESEDDLDASDAQQRKLLIIVLGINFGLFVMEIMAGFAAQSMGLVADSLDMLADAIVYGLSLYAVGKAVAQKQRVARISGYFQLFLAVFGIVEVIRRLAGAGDEPSFTLMIIISMIAFAGNVAALLILRRAQSQDVHMKASWIFTSNDVLVNISVIIAGVLVFVTGSQLPDLVVGGVVFCLVASGAFRILRLSRS
jgi:Co/Zn/Cd efflux system component